MKEKNTEKDLNKDLNAIYESNYGSLVIANNHVVSCSLIFNDT